MGWPPSHERSSFICRPCSRRVSRSIRGDRDRNPHLTMAIPLNERIWHLDHIALPLLLVPFKSARSRSVLCRWYSVMHSARAYYRLSPILPRGRPIARYDRSQPSGPDSPGHSQGSLDDDPVLSEYSIQRSQGVADINTKNSRSEESSLSVGRCQLALPERPLSALTRPHPLTIFNNLIIVGSGALPSSVPDTCLSELIADPRKLSDDSQFNYGLTLFPFRGAVSSSRTSPPRPETLFPFRSVSSQL